MNIFEKIAKKLAPGLITEKEMKAQMARYSSLSQENRDEMEAGFRPLSGGDVSRRETPYISYYQMIEQANYMYVMSGLTKRFVQDTANFVLGDGVTYEVFNDHDGKAKAILDDFWDDSRNNMDINLDARVQALGLLGEQCWPVSVGKYGRVWISYIDTAQINDVETVYAFPEIPSAVKVAGARMEQVMPVVREETDPRNKNFGRLVGECFYFSVNKMPSMPRGYSDLVSQLDYIENYESGLFGEFDRRKFLDNFIWDVLIKDATPEEITAFERIWRKPPTPGTVRVHDDNIVWTAVSPDLKASDNKTFYDLAKSYLSSCVNRPTSWLGEGGKAYQTEADMMQAPTFKDLKKRQRYVKYMLEYVLKFVLDQAIIAGRITEDTENPYKIKVVMPEMSKKDMGKAVVSMSQLTSALTQAMSKGWITRETSAKFFAYMAEQTGFEINVEEELKKAKSESEQEKEESETDYRDKDVLSRKPDPVPG